MNPGKLVGLTFIVALLFVAPNIVRASGGNSEFVSCRDSKVPGCVLLTFNGVDVHWNGPYPWTDFGVTEFGSPYQCVELIQRYYYYVHGYPKYWMPYYAYQVFDDWGHFPTMDAYPNGSPTPPKKGDILVFNRNWDNPYGHVAIVEGVEDGRIEFVQQNMLDLGEDSLPIDEHNLIDSGGYYGPVRGWIHDTLHPEDPPAPPSEVMVQHQTVTIPTPSWVRLTIAAQGHFRFQVDGQTVFEDSSDIQTDWLSIGEGTHDVKLFVERGASAHFNYEVKRAD